MAKRRKVEWEKEKEICDDFIKFLFLIIIFVIIFENLHFNILNKNLIFNVLNKLYNSKFVFCWKKNKILCFYKY